MFGCEMVIQLSPKSFKSETLKILDLKKKFAGKKPLFFFF